MNISTKNLNKLSDIKTIKNLSKSLAALDAILCSEWEFRYYSYDSKWSDSEELGSMRDGSGSEYKILFNQYGAAINGFDCDSKMSPWISKKPKYWPGLFENMPSEFQEFIDTEPIPSIGTTFFIWRLNKDKTWKTGTVTFPKGRDDGSEELLYILDGNPLTYQKWAEEYYEMEVSLDLVKKIYGMNKIDASFLKKLKVEIDDLDQLRNDLVDIGYPINF
ncbi:hypothetical protein EHO58_01440 [Leptospira selangorensis]|uniref:hypothetical protein n=1 Tax=Leptospira selangorensis TaxID=2484982 RepID=UPI001082B001|nr:hypothetical protein [Leptospira selangorensis]TGK10674.1 hypothetical protein EHO58_01440 [Leptospira selangorensis]